MRKALCEVSLESQQQTRLLFVQHNSFSEHTRTELSVKISTRADRVTSQSSWLQIQTENRD